MKEEKEMALNRSEKGVFLWVKGGNFWCLEKLGGIVPPPLSVDFIYVLNEQINLSHRCITLPALVT